MGNVVLNQDGSDLENPLLWPIYEVLKQHPREWKVHTLAGELDRLGMMPQLDSIPTKDLFKRNFLIMNGLYQLQVMLYPENWLQVEAMDIQLLTPTSSNCININDPLREYYTEWRHYDADEGEVKSLLNEFWQRYNHFVGGTTTNIESRRHALRLFDLPENATAKEIRKRWRILALKWHPDRESGNTDRFRVLCEAWSVLRQ